MITLPDDAIQHLSHLYDRPAATPDAIAAALTTSLRSTKGHLAGLAAAGLARQTGDGTWTTTVDGNMWVEAHRTTHAYTWRQAKSVKPNINNRLHAVTSDGYALCHMPGPWAVTNHPNAIIPCKSCRDAITRLSLPRHDPT